MANDKVILGKQKECPFSINKMNKYYLLPFLVPLVCFSTKFFSELMKTNLDTIKIEFVTDENTHTFVFLYQMINSTSIIFAGLLYFISIIRAQTDNKANIGVISNRSETNSSDYSFMAKKKPNRLLEYSIIFFMSIIITLYNILKGYGAKHPCLEKRLYFLFFFCLINIFLFKKPFYSHQKFSLGIGLIGMAMIFTMFFVYRSQEYEYIYDVLLFFGSFVYSLYLVLVKYMSENKGYSPFLLLFIIGIISTVATVVGFLILSKVRAGDIRYVSNIFHCRLPEMYVCFGNFYNRIIPYFLINAVLQILIFLVCYYFSPEVFAISDIISPFLSLVVKLCQGGEKRALKIVLDCLGYVIIIIASFIYNEIIVCNFWGLNKNTWKAIVKKANDDYLGRITDVTDSIGDDDLDIEMTSTKNGFTTNNRTSSTDLTADLTERGSL